MRHRTLLPIVLLAVTAMPRAAQPTLTLSDIDDAIRTGQTRIAADRARFHAQYRFVVGQPPVDYIDVITPFRRVVLAADQHAQVGDRAFGQRQAMQLLNDAAGEFDFVVELTLHPLNTFVGIPAFDVALAAGRLRVLPASLDRRPRFGPRVEGLPPPIPQPGGQIPGTVAQPVLGGTVTARFKGNDVDPTGTMTLIVSEQGKELARARVDLAGLR